VQQPLQLVAVDADAKRRPTHAGPSRIDRMDSRSHSRVHLPPDRHLAQDRNRLGYDQTFEALNVLIAQLCTYRGMTIICQSAAQNGGYFALPGRSSRRAAEPRSDRLPSLTESRNVSLARGCRSI
jgi:hypothetical protein